MELTTREGALISYALQLLAGSNDPVILATAGEINDLAGRVVIATIKGAN